MKKIISINLDREILEKIDKEVKEVKYRNRSHAIEEILIKALQGKWQKK